MSLASPPTTPPHSSSTAPPPSTTFDTISHYNKLIASDRSRPAPIAAIESLIALLQSSSLTTVSETLTLLSSQSRLLLFSQQNPIPVSAGTELFQRYLVSSFQQHSLPQRSDFTALRTSLIANSKVFIQRAKQAPNKISQHALPFIQDESTIITFTPTSHPDPITSSILTTASDSNHYFSLITLTTASLPPTPPKAPHPTIPTATLPLHALTYTLNSLPSTTLQKTLILLPATSVLENGAIISHMGTHQIALIAHAYNIPVYIAVPSYTFVRSFPLGSGNTELRQMGVHQDLLQFHPPLTTYDSDDDDDNTAPPPATQRKRKAGTEQKEISKAEEMIEIVPPHLITALITENGIMTPEGVSEELIKLWL